MSANAKEPLRLTSHDLFTPQVENYLDEQRILRRDVPEAPPRSWIVRVFYSSYFYLSLASGLGAFVGWAIIEPFMSETEAAQGNASILPALLLFPTVAGFIGLFLGSVEGVMCRNPRRALISASVGLAVGFLLGCVSIFVGGFFYLIAHNMAISINKPGAQTLTGFAFLLQMMGRAVAWSIAAIPAGLGQGIALRDKKVAINGLLGSVVGGLIGGLLFDPIEFLLTDPMSDADLSRAVGFTCIGLFVGLFVGVVEQWTKTAWLLMKAGPLAGKQFLLTRNPTVMGSSPKADIYLFKDEAIEPQHALIHNRGGRYEIEDMRSEDGTYVNGIPVQRRVLQAGDQIVLGKTVLEFSLREVR